MVFFQASRVIFPAFLPYCTSLVYPVYKNHIGVLSGMCQAPIPIYYRFIPSSYQLALPSPRRNTARNSPRAMGPATNSCNAALLPRRAKFVKVRAEVFHKGCTALSTPRRKRHFAHFLSHFHNSFQGLHNFICISLYSLRIDKTLKSMYNKVRNREVQRKLKRELIPLT